MKTTVWRELVSWSTWGFTACGLPKPGIMPGQVLKSARTRERERERHAIDWLCLVSWLCLYCCKLTSPGNARKWQNRRGIHNNIRSWKHQQARLLPRRYLRLRIRRCDKKHRRHIARQTTDIYLNGHGRRRGQHLPLNLQISTRLTVLHRPIRTAAQENGFFRMPSHLSHTQATITHMP